MSAANSELEAQSRFGPMLIGLVVAAVLGGITIVQALTFLRTSKRDPLQHKVAVYLLLILDILHISFFAHLVYHYLVVSPSDISLVWSFPALLFLHNSIPAIVQAFYIARIWKLTPQSRKYLPIVMTLMILAIIATGTYLSGLASKKSNFAQATSVATLKATVAVYSMRACLEVLIAGSMIFLLARAGTNLHWTDSSLTMLLAYILNSGMVASFVAIAALAAVLISPHTLVFLALDGIVTKLYVNGFMGMLNARYYLQPPSCKPATTFFLRSETSSHTGLKGKTQEQTQTLSKTINEVGLPLFKLNSSKSETDNDVRVVEVMVKEEAHRSTG